MDKIAPFLFCYLFGVETFSSTKNEERGGVGAGGAAVYI